MVSPLWRIIKTNFFFDKTPTFFISTKSKKTKLFWGLFLFHCRFGLLHGKEFFLFSITTKHILSFPVEAMDVFIFVSGHQKEEGALVNHTVMSQ